MTGPDGKPLAMEKRILFTGCRHWSPRALIEEAVFAPILKLYLPSCVTIVHGACPTGIDSLVDEIARRLGFRVEPHEARWGDIDRDGAVIRRRGDGTLYDAQAGPHRNTEMVRLGAALCLAFHPDILNSKGTADCARKAIAAGIPCYLWDSERSAGRKITTL